MIKWIVAPIVGGVIGYITNDLAIRMLFHPRKEVYIGKFHVPFTPGLIPKQKGRIALSVGKVVSEQLLNEETLRQTMFSEQTIGTLQGKVRELVLGLKDDPRTIDELLASRFSPEVVKEKAEAVEHYLTDRACEGLSGANVGQAVVDSLWGSIMEAVAQNKLLARLIDANTHTNTRARLAKWVDDMVAEKAPEVIYRVLDEHRVAWQQKRVCDLYEAYQDKQEILIQRGTALYVNLLGSNVDKMLRAINIEQIVVDKINGFDAAQLEAMIFGVMKRELRAIVYLGAALGFLMGFINVFI